MSFFFLLGELNPIRGQVYLPLSYNELYHCGGLYWTNSSDKRIPSWTGKSNRISRFDISSKVDCSSQVFCFLPHQLSWRYIITMNAKLKLTVTDRLKLGRTGYI